MLKKREILHIDMDAFYASVEQRDNPLIREKPVIVGADPNVGRGVVSAASYEARRYGVRSAMPIAHAYKLCPGGVFLGVDMGKYKKVSEKIHEILNMYTPNIEPISLDEAFLDLTGSKYQGEVRELAKSIQDRIYKETELSASVGLSYNKFLAKLASDMRKPKGFMVIEDEDTVKKHVWPLPVEKIWGVGPKTKEQLFYWGVTTVGALAAFPPDFLKKKLGVYGEELWLLAWGKDDRPVVTDRTPKSIAKETTFDRDINNREVLLSSLMLLTENVSYRLREKEFFCRTVTLKLRDESFATTTRNYSFSNPVNSDVDIYYAARKLMEKHWNGKPLRLIGVSAGGLSSENSQQLVFFEEDSRKVDLLETVDNIRLKYGFNSIGRARSKDLSGRRSR